MNKKNEEKAEALTKHEKCKSLRLDSSNNCSSISQAVIKGSFNFVL